jgi:hypothetical protein
MLWVGDPHVTPDDLTDAQALVDYIAEVAEQNKPDMILLAGDLHDTHAIIRSEVMYFWRESLKKLTNHAPVTILKGNHDAPGTAGTKACSLWAYSDMRRVKTVIEHAVPTFDSGLVFAPYMSNEELIKTSQALPNQHILFCHATFEGGRYDNGIYAPDGVDPELMAQKYIISGHLHSPHSFGKVLYPGAPRWRNLGDAEVANRAIWLYEIDHDPAPLLSLGCPFASPPIPFYTGDRVRRIIALDDRENCPMDPDMERAAKDRLYVNIVGSQLWIDSRRPLWEGKAKIRTTRTDPKQTARVKESEGLSKAFDRWTGDFVAPRGTSSQTLKDMAKVRLG